MTALLAVLCAFGALACAFQFGAWWIIDKALHVHAVESFFRACYDVTVRRQIRQWMADVPGEGPYRSVARADRVTGLESRRIA
jgi:hypothetical protein